MVDNNNNKNTFSHKPGSPNPVDIHVGTRLKQRRVLLGISQEKLAEAIGITFQQIQKYERGANRISASRLFQFSKLLNVPVSYFFEKFSESGGTKDNGLSYGLADNAQEEFSSKNSIDEDIMNRKETLNLLRVYYSVKDEKARKDMLAVLKTIASNM